MSFMNNLLAKNKLWFFILILLSTILLFSCAKTVSPKQANVDKDSLKITQQIINESDDSLYAKVLYAHHAEAFFRSLINSVSYEEVGRDKIVGKEHSEWVVEGEDTLNRMTLYHFQSTHFRFTNAKNDVCTDEVEHERDYMVVENKKYSLNGLCWYADIYNNYEFEFGEKKYLASFLFGSCCSSNPHFSIMLFEKIDKDITMYFIEAQASYAPVIFSDFNNDKILDFAHLKPYSDTIRTYSLQKSKPKLLPYYIMLKPKSGSYYLPEKHIDTLRSNWNFKK